MKTNRAVTATGVLLVMGLATSQADASFVRFKQCVEHCLQTGGYWDQVACILDCELALARCVATLGAAGQVSYPAPDPACIYPNIGDAIGGWAIGTPVPFRVQSLSMTGTVTSPPMMGNSQATYEAFAAQYAGQSFSPNSMVVVRALPWNAPLNPGEDMDASAAHTDPLWNTGALLYSGGLNGSLNTSQLGGGLSLVRVAVTSNGFTSYSIGALNMVPGPGSAGLGGMGLLFMARRRRR